MWYYHPLDTTWWIAIGAITKALLMTSCCVRSSSCINYIYIYICIIRFHKLSQENQSASPLDHYKQLSLQSHCTRMKLIVLVCILGALGYAKADCYPGDTAYTNIVQQIYGGVTSDNIVLTFLGSVPMNRQALCNILVNHHNSGKNPGQAQTNREYLGHLHITQSTCVNALTYTHGYNTISGWQEWAGYHSGHWYAETVTFNDGARWHAPYYKYDPGQTYAVQSVRFDSQDRKDNCNTVDPMTGATCRYGWNQSGQGVSIIHKTKSGQF